MSDYFVADELRDISSAYMLGYQYPETPFNLAGDPKALAAYAGEQVQKLYGPLITQSPSYGKTPLDGAPATNAPAVYRKEWQAFVRVKRFAIPGSWFVHIFLGEPDTDHGRWVASAVGSVAVFAPRNIATCRNCVSQAGRDLDVSGVVYLTEAIIKALGPSLDDDTVVRYLKDNLQWRVAGVSSSLRCIANFIEELVLISYLSTKTAWRRISARECSRSDGRRVGGKRYVSSGKWQITSVSSRGTVSRDHARQGAARGL